MPVRCQHRLFLTWFPFTRTTNIYSRRTLLRDPRHRGEDEASRCTSETKTDYIRRIREASTWPWVPFPWIGRSQAERSLLGLWFLQREKRVGCKRRRLTTSPGIVNQFVRASTLISFHKNFRGIYGDQPQGYLIVAEEMKTLTTTNTQVFGGPRSLLQRPRSNPSHQLCTSAELSHTHTQSVYTTTKENNKAPIIDLTEMEIYEP